MHGAAFLVDSGAFFESRGDVHVELSVCNRQRPTDPVTDVTLAVHTREGLHHRVRGLDREPKCPDLIIYYIILCYIILYYIIL